jgi:hypothetical protein
MDHLMELVTIALERTYVAGESDVTAQTLEAVAELLTLRRDAIRVIDAPGQKKYEPCCASRVHLWYASMSAIPE